MPVNHEQIQKIDKLIGTYMETYYDEGRISALRKNRLLNNF